MALVACAAVVVRAARYSEQFFQVAPVPTVKPADLAHAEEPRPTWMRVDVVTIDRHVPATVRVTVPADPPADPVVDPVVEPEGRRADR